MAGKMGNGRRFHEIDRGVMTKEGGVGRSVSWKLMEGSEEGPWKGARVNSVKCWREVM